MEFPLAMTILAVIVEEENGEWVREPAKSHAWVCRFADLLLADSFAAQ